MAVTSCGFNAFHQYKGGDLWGWSQDKYMPRIADRYDKDHGVIMGAVAPKGNIGYAIGW